MAIIKCKNCGGDINISEDKTFGVCEYCGSSMTLPKVDSDQRAAAFNRGNHFRRIGEFDRALEIYERIISENEKDAEAHWCCALCRFGIEYVEDPATYEWLPTCHRASFDSFLEDVDYLAAVEYSDGITRRQYQKDAAKIAEVQRGVLATSQKEEPFDVFICYKESDENGQRTLDSTLAQDVYYQLTDKGWRVFFSRITLEDKGGTEYEPYIFAALNSAKVMVVVGTSAEHFNAVWVKNEWSRFLSLMKKDHTKFLLPCYRDMDPYDLPDQLSVLQSYDMSKIGFVQDLIRGIGKIIEKKPVVTQPYTVAGSSNADALTQRGMMAIEDGEPSEAMNFFERALDINPSDALAYIGKFLVIHGLKSLDELKNKIVDLDNSREFNRALQFGSADLIDSLQQVRYENSLKIERLRLLNFLKKHTENETTYENALRAEKCATTEAEWKKAAWVYGNIPSVKDARQRRTDCLNRAEQAHDDACKDQRYRLILQQFNAAVTEYDYTLVAGKFEELSGWRDSEEKSKQAYAKAEEARRKNRIYNEAVEKSKQAYAKAEEARRKKNRIYNEAVEKMSTEDTKMLSSAIDLFMSIPDWKDAKSKAQECQYKVNKAEREKEEKEIRKTSIITGIGVVVVVALILVIFQVIIWSM